MASITVQADVYNEQLNRVQRIGYKTVRAERIEDDNLFYFLMHYASSSPIGILQRNDIHLIFYQESYNIWRLAYYPLPIRLVAARYDATLQPIPMYISSSLNDNDLLDNLHVRLGTHESRSEILVTPFSEVKQFIHNKLVRNKNTLRRLNSFIKTSNVLDSDKVLIVDYHDITKQVATIKVDIKWIARTMKFRSKKYKDTNATMHKRILSRQTIYKLPLAYCNLRLESIFDMFLYPFKFNDCLTYKDVRLRAVLGSDVVLPFVVIDRVDINEFIKRTIRHDAVQVVPISEKYNKYLEIDGIKEYLCVVEDTIELIFGVDNDDKLALILVYYSPFIRSLRFGKSKTCRSMLKQTGSFIDHSDLDILIHVPKDKSIDLLRALRQNL